MRSRGHSSRRTAGTAKYRDLVETSDELMGTADRQGRWTFVNRAATQRILGYSPEELLGRPIFELLAEDAEREIEVFAQVLAGAEKQRYETAFLRKDGERVILSFNARAMRDASGEIVGVMATGADVTGRRRIDQDLRQSLEKLRKNKERLERQNEVLARIAGGEPLPETLFRLTVAIEDQAEGMLCSILLLNPDDLRLTTGAAPNLPPEYSRAIDGTKIGPSAGSCGTAAFREERVVVTDIETDPLWADYRHLAIAHGLRACWSQPIISSGGKVMGTFAMYYRQPRSPTAAEIELIETAAHIAAIAIEAARARDQLVHSALHDPLTGLPNRTLLADRLGMAMKRSQRHQDAIFAVLFVDIDRFKLVNDSLGHMAGDELLRLVAERLNGCLRPADTVARLGGDEFAMLLEDLEDDVQASKIALRIQQAFAAAFDFAGQEVYLSASIGITLSSGGYGQPEELLRDADTAMYQAKSEGRARHAVFDPAMHVRALSRFRIESDLHRALARGQFRLHYQPIVDLASGRIAGFEALLRWQHPEMGLLSPDSFLAAAEETGIIPELGSWVLREACWQLRAWQQTSPRAAGLTVNVNLHTSQVVPHELAALVREVLEETGLAAGSLNLEITEGMLLQGPEATLATLRELRSLGAGICLDDFGTGYSSLSYLILLPVTTLKIDRSFVGGLRGPRELAIVESIASLAHSLELDIVAEGVETEEQLETLRGLGCQSAQGFLFSPALDSAAAERLLPAGS